jgi:hypothetical protein
MTHGNQKEEDDLIEVAVVEIDFRLSEEDHRAEEADQVDWRVEEAYGVALEALRQAYECFTQYEEKASEAAKLALIAWGEGIAYERPAGQGFINRQEAFKAHRKAYAATGERHEIQACYLKAKAHHLGSEDPQALQEIQALCEEIFAWRDKRGQGPTEEEAQEAYRQAQADEKAETETETETSEAEGNPI